MVPALSLHSGPVSEEPGELGRIVADAASGRESAWERLVDLYSRRVFAMARSRLHDDDLAEEITQSVFVTVATKLRQTEGYSEQGRFEPWLFRITMNRVRDLARKRSRQATPVAPEHMAEVRGPGDEAGEVRQRDHDRREMDRLRSAMERLNDVDREIIELRHHGQLSFKQIAEITGDPLGTLLARHHRALKKLRTIIEEAQQHDSPQNESPENKTGQNQ